MSLAAGIDPPEPRETIQESATGGRKAVRREDYSLLYGPWVAGVLSGNYAKGGVGSALGLFAEWQEGRVVDATLLAVGEMLCDHVGDEYQHELESPTGRPVTLTEEGRIAVGLNLVSRVASYGAQKYARHNYRRGVPYSSYIASFWRHVVADYAGDHLDPESGEPHLAHAAWHTMALYCNALTGVGVDDRACTTEPDVPDEGVLAR